MINRNGRETRDFQRGNNTILIFNQTNIVEKYYNRVTGKEKGQIPFNKYLFSLELCRGREYD